MAQGKVTATTLNLRTAPNTGSSIVVSLPTGEIVDIIGTVTGGSFPLPSGGISTQWHNVRINGQTGFVAAAFVQLLAPPGTLQGNIELAPPGLLGFDCASKLSRSLYLSRLVLVMSLLTVTTGLMKWRQKVTFQVFMLEQEPF